MQLNLTASVYFGPQALCTGHRNNLAQKNENVAFLSLRAGVDSLRIYQSSAMPSIISDLYSVRGSYQGLIISSDRSVISLPLTRGST